MWVVVGDEWCVRGLNRRKHNEDYTEREFALPDCVTQAGRRKGQMRQRNGSHRITTFSRENSDDATCCTVNALSPED